MSCGSAGRASRSRATRRPAFRRWRSPPPGSSAASSTPRSSARSIWPAISAAFWRGNSFQARSDRANQKPTSPADGAVALVLKRLEDAQRDGDHIYAVLRDSDGGWGHLDRPGAEDSFALGSIENDLGAAGAASGLASVAKAALCLDAQIIPGLRDCPSRLGDPGVIGSSGFLPDGPQFWMRNRAEGPRRATVATSNLGGDSQFVILEEFEGDRGGGLSPGRPIEAPEHRLGLFAIEAGDRPGLAEQIKRLAVLARSEPSAGIARLARQWWTASRNDPRLAHGMAIVADGVGPLARLLEEALEHVSSGHHAEPHRAVDLNRIYFGQSIPSVPKRMAFVYPGLGNQFHGMGAGCRSCGPRSFAQDAENGFLRDQLDPRVWWSDQAPRAFDGHCVPILGSVSLGCFVTDLLRGLGLAPDAAIGYSLGETAALVALRAWTRRDEMLQRLQSSPLFHTELAGPCDAARRVWGIPAAEPVNWVAGIVPCAPEAVRLCLRCQNAR